METDATAKQRDLSKDVTDLIQIIGQTLNVTLLYGITHKVSQSSLAISYTVINKFIEFHENIHFSISDGSLLINGESTAGSPLATSFTTKLTGLNLLSFTIEPGFSLNECIALFTLFLTHPSKVDTTKNASELMEGLGLLHIQAKSFSYRRVSEDEPVGEIPAAPATPPPPADDPVPAPPDLENIMAFLKDERKADADRSAEDIRQLAADSEKLAELILRSAEIRSSQANLSEGESLSDLIVGCIQKAVQPIIKDPAAKTQKGRKQIKHSLVLLEKALLDRLKEMSGDQAIHATEAMMDEIVEDLDIDGIASKYLKTRRLAEKTSEKMSRLIERSTDDPEQLEELRVRLMDQGLTPEGWLELTLKPADPSQGTAHGGSGGDGVNEITMLTLLLAQIDESIHHPPTTETSAEVQTLLTEASQHLSSLTEITDKKIQTLQSILTDKTNTHVLSRSELLEILAEIAQEIMQPLTIITGTVAMLRSLKAGPFTTTQGELLSMIAESSDRMTLLINHLMHLAGPPLARNPDHAILNAAYNRT